MSSIDSKEINDIYHNVELGLDKTSFIYNDYYEHKQVLKDISYYLLNCEEYYFSVAFINEGGLTKLKQVLKEADEKGIKGKIITTNYLCFSDPKALIDLTKLKNVEVRMYYLTKEDTTGFHTKGYIFKNKDNYDVIIGSSNITQSALTSNKEWNNRISGTRDIKAINDVVLEFNKMFEESLPLKEVIDEYRNEYNAHLAIYKEGNIVNDIVKYRFLEPNEMQKQFIFNLNKIIDKGENRGLLISATGTGKTFASAFASKAINRFKVKKLLFIAHREIILSQAKSTFDYVYENNVKSALLTGNNKEYEGSDFIFASFSMMIKKEVREKFRPNEFDLIIIDEVHRVGENRYQDIINYFKPKFLLGMSATPDRMDGYDLYKLFDHNIIYEIRLMDALNLKLLTPFSYFGIKDISSDGRLINEGDFNKLTSEERVKHIIEEADYYGYSGSRVKGLIFVSSVEVGKEISNKMNKLGKRTIFLDGTSSPRVREEAIKRLEREEIKEDNLDYILTVNVFNEGVDIPSVNQIILLRPTESAIIFIQQLGRGLRKYFSKEYVVILDFIGNYDKNFNIARALTKGKLTKGNAVKTITDILPGESTISFDQVSKEAIYKSIDRANLSSKRDLYLSYKDVKARLNKIPSLIEFDENSELPVDLFFSLFGSYYDFLYEKGEVKEKLSKEENVVLNYLSKYAFNGKRHIEIDLLENLINSNHLFKVPENYLEDYKIKALKEFLFISKKMSKLDKDLYLGHYYDLTNEIKISDRFLNALNNQLFNKFFLDSLRYASFANKKYYEEKDSLVLYKKYTRSDVVRLINISRNNVSVIYGYQVYEKEHITPIFINYVKGKEAIQYEDRFIDHSYIQWSSRDNRTTDTNEIKKLVEFSKNGVAPLNIFIQKSNKEIVKNEGYYYLGKASIINYENIEINGIKRVHFIVKLDKPVPDDIYKYLVSNL